MQIAIVALLTSFSSVALADRPDGWITTKTKLALWTTRGIDSTEIDVDSIDGAVTLHGKVESEAAKEKAERETKKIDGVKSVRNLIAVVPESAEKAVKKSDKEIRDAIRDAFKNDPELAKSGIQLRSVNAGTVLLGGKTNDINHQWQAVRVARGTPGVKSVASEVQVTELDRSTEPEMAREQRPHGKLWRDGWITTDVKLRLIGDGEVPAMSINVDTRDGVVKLFGNVPSEDAKRAAERDAAKIEGVERVENDLQVVPGSETKVAAAKDEDVQKDVRNKIDKSDGLSDVKVDVKGGVVHLTGNVTSHAQRLRASMVARSTPGVRAVSNDLDIKKKGD
jgi:osmotically-inducible protein OsmY